MIETLARLGYAANGVVYVVIGVLAVQAALGSGGKTTGSGGAVQTIAAQPFGKFLLALLSIGMVGYIIWSFVQAIMDPENRGTDAKGILSRVGYAVSGLLYIGLAATAIRLAIGSSSGGGGGGTQQKTASLLQQPFGKWLVGIIGVLVIGVAIYQLYKAYSMKFRKELNLGSMSLKQQTWAIRICRFGLGARAVVLAITGFFLIQAARQSNPQQARGLDGVLQTLAQQPYGKFLLALVALGLVAFAIYMLLLAKYARIQTP